MVVIEALEALERGYGALRGGGDGQRAGWIGHFEDAVGFRARQSRGPGDGDYPKIEGPKDTSGYEAELASEARRARRVSSMDRVFASKLAAQAI